MENRMYEDRNEDAIEIDVVELLFALRKKLWMIILAAMIGCLGAGIYSKVILSPVYTSTSMVYVLSKETTLTSLADLQIGSQLTGLQCNDYQQACSGGGNRKTETEFIL